MTPAAVVFDLFGTLLDVGSLSDAVAGLAADPAAFVATWREKQIAYAFASAIVGAHEDFDSLTERGLRYAAAKHGVTLDASTSHRLADAWRRLAPYPDAKPALARLRERGLRCAVLTNGTPATAAAAIRNAGLDGLLDAVLSVESAGVFKPDRRVYALATAHHGVAAGRLIFVSGNGWDAAGAAAFGLRVAWCNRSGAPAETFGPSPEWTLTGLDALPTIVAGAAEEAARPATAECPP